MDQEISQNNGNKTVSTRPNVAWYVLPVVLGIVGSVIMWYYLKDSSHLGTQEMINKGWIVGIVLTLIGLAWIPLLVITNAFI